MFSRLILSVRIILFVSSVAENISGKLQDVEKQHFSSAITQDPHHPLSQVVTKIATNIENHDVKPIYEARSGDFYQFVQMSSMWADKSRLVEPIMRDNRTIFIITGPKRWGKSLNLGMLKLYFEIPIDRMGTQVPIKESHSYKYFIGGEIKNGGDIHYISPKPLISHCKEMHQHLGHYPIIVLNGNMLNMQKGVLRSFQNMINFAYKLHNYLPSKWHKVMQDNAIDEGVKKKTSTFLNSFHRYHDPEAMKSLDENDLVVGIVGLSKMLYAYYGNRKVIILYDEHDFFIRTYCFSNTESVADKKRSFLTFLEKFMLSTFKDNIYIEKAIITGILKIREATYLSKLNCTMPVSIFGFDELFPFYGIYESEFQAMMEHRKIDEQMKYWSKRCFNGYRTLGHQNDTMYSTYLISKFITELKIENYWERFGTKDFFAFLIKQDEFISDLCDSIRAMKKNEYNGVQIKYEVFREMELKQCEILAQLQRGEIEYNSGTHRDIVFSFLVMIGFGSVHENNKHLLTSKECGSDSLINIRLANQEIFDPINSFIIDATTFRINGHFPGYMKIKFRTSRDAWKYIGQDDETGMVTAQIALAVMQVLILKRPLQVTKNWKIETNIESLKEIIRTDKLVNATLSLRHGRSIESNEDIIRTFTVDMFLYMMRKEQLELNNQYKFVTQLEPYNRETVDVYVFQNQRALFVELKFSELHDKYSTKSVFIQCLEYVVIHRAGNFHFDVIKCMAIHVDSEGKVDVWSTTMPKAQVIKAKEDFKNHMNSKSTPDRTPVEGFTRIIPVKDKNFENFMESLFNGLNSNGSITKSLYDPKEISLDEVYLISKLSRSGAKYS